MPTKHNNELIDFSFHHRTTMERQQQQHQWNTNKGFSTSNSRIMRNEKENPKSVVVAKATDFYFHSRHKENAFLLRPPTPVMSERIAEAYCFYCADVSDALTLLIVGAVM